MLSKFLLLILILFFLLSQVNCVKKKITNEVEAEKIAQKTLKKYAIENKISLKNIKLSENEKTYFDKEVRVWVFFYVAENQSPHRINILVDQFGNAEVHEENS